jgi:broad specificity phosphatase PhoE
MSTDFSWLTIIGKVTTAINQDFAKIKLMKITYFVHSITEDNEKGLATGWMQGKLSAEGIKRAIGLREDLSNRDFDAVFCSDLERAIQSTELFFDNKFPLFIDWRLRECNYGKYDGLPAKQFKKDREQEYIQSRYPSGESYMGVESRIKSFLSDLSQFDYDHIAIVGHQAPQLALDVILKNKSWVDAIADDWRKTHSWQPGWEYSLG